MNLWINLFSKFKGIYAVILSIIGLVFVLMSIKNEYNYYNKPLNYYNKTNGLIEEIYLKSSGEGSEFRQVLFLKLNNSDSTYTLSHNFEFYTLQKVKKNVNVQVFYDDRLRIVHLNDNANIWVDYSLKKNKVKYNIFTLSMLVIGLLLFAYWGILKLKKDSTR